MFFIFVFLMMC